MKIIVTQSAFEQIQLMKENDFTLGEQEFRVQISGKGCDGFDYQMGFDKKKNDDKEIRAYNDQLIILMDPFTEFYTSEATIDYVFDHVNNCDGFSITNHKQHEHKGKFFKDTSKLPPWAKS